MASPVPAEDQSNTKTEEGATAFNKKRSRRVSFAENTSVHIYDCDDTPPDSEPRSPPPSEDLGLTGRDSGNEDDDDMDESGPRIPFFRVFGSPSSGASTASATSNDEDNFFGPVIPSFIRQDLSDSALSGDNHDQTMDSTAFSMHFRSFARSDSEDLKTLTKVNLSFEEKTPTSGPRNTMQLTLVNKPNPRPDVSISKSSMGSHSSDMSVVGEYHDKYDYGNLLPAMNPLIAIDHNDLLSVSRVTVQKSLIKSGQDNNIKGIVSDDEHKKQIETGVADDRLKLLSNKLTAFGVLSKSLSPNQYIRDTLSVKTNKPVRDAFGANSSFEFSTTSQPTPLNHTSTAHQLNNVVGKENESLLVGSITRSTYEPSHMLLNGVDLFKSPGTVTPFNNSTSFLQRASLSSLQKSISKLRILEASPFSATLNAKLQDSNSRSFAGLSKMTPLGDLLNGNKIKTPKNVVASQVVLPYESTLFGEHVHQTIIKSPDIRNGYKDDENKICSTPVYVAGSNIGEKVHESGDLLYDVHNNSDTKWNSTSLSNNIEHEKFQPVMKDSLVLNGRMDENSCQKNLADQFGRSLSDKENNDTFNAENVPSQVNSVERKRKAENVTTDKVVKVKTSTSSGPELPSDNGVLSIGPNLEQLTKIHIGFFKETKLLPDTKGNPTNLSNNIEHEKFQPVMKDSLVLNGRMDENSCQKNLADQFGRSPSNKENNDTFNAENVPSQVNTSDPKREAENVNTDKVVKVKMSSSSGLELPSDNGMLSIGPNLEHLTKIHTGFFKETKLLSDSVDKMNFHAIDRLDDILGQLQRSKTYQLLSDEYRSQDKRAVETKLTLCKLVYAQVKLQLMHLKRERLLKNVHSYASRIRESTIKLNPLQTSRDAQVSNEIEECQVDRDKIASMTQVVKDIDTRLSILTKSFHISCKMKGEPNTADTIANANSYLMKRARCQIIRKDLQLWVIVNLKNSKDHHDIVLNYLDLMSQRLTVTAGVVPRLSVSNRLNQMNIHKNFKDMDASTAFGFVFDTCLVQKHLTATSMAQETQMTTSLLGNLVDVMEEIQLAKIELKNLIHARFHTSFDERLDLELYFFDSNSRKKATVTLNASCLKRGIYPADVVACQISVTVDESQISSKEKLTAEITAAVKDLRVGFFSILRLCRSVSQLLSLQGKK